jgi:hypothetical protein
MELRQMTYAEYMEKYRRYLEAETAYAEDPHNQDLEIAATVAYNAQFRAYCEYVKGRQIIC